MTDSFVLLTPILMLGLMTLVRFVGCNAFYDIEETAVKVDQAEKLLAKAGDSYVKLTWNYDTAHQASKFILHWRAEQDATYMTRDVAAVPDSLEQTAFVSPLSNGTRYFFKVEPVSVNWDPDQFHLAPEVSEEPLMGEFLTVTTPGPNRNDFAGWVGMAILVKDNPLIVTQLGRWAVMVNTTPHTVRIFDVVEEVTRISVTVPPGTPGTFTFVTLPPKPPEAPPLVLTPGLYYVVSEEFAGGDPFLNIPTLVAPFGEADDTNVATVLAPVYSTAQAPDTFQHYGIENETYGPVNFRY